MAEIDDHTFVFVGGLHRTGTSFLGNHLSEQPGASGFRNTGASEDEGQWLQTVIPTERAYGGAGLFGLTDALHLTEASPFATRETGIRQFEQWKRYWDLKKPVLVEKTPSNITRSRMLSRAFPNTRFVFLMRHPLVSALATQKWSTCSLPILLVNALRVYHRMLTDLTYIDDFAVVRYEAISPHSGEIFHALSALIGLDFPEPVSFRQGVNASYQSMMYSTAGKHWRSASSESPRGGGITLPLTRLFNRFIEKSGFTISSLELERTAFGQLLEKSRFSEAIRSIGYNTENFDYFDGPVIFTPADKHRLDRMRVSLEATFL